MKAYRAPTSASVIYMLQLKNGERKGDSLTQQRSAVPFLIGEPVGKNVREERGKGEGKSQSGTDRSGPRQQVCSQRQNDCSPSSKGTEICREKKQRAKDN